MSLIDRAKYESVFSDLANLKPIHKRVTNIEIELLLQREFKLRDLDLDYDYRIFDSDLATKVGSDRYTNLENIERYSMPLFQNDKGESTFSLVVGFLIEYHILDHLFLFLLFIHIIYVNYYYFFFGNNIQFNKAEEYLRNENRFYK